MKKSVEYCLWMYCLLVPWCKPVTVSYFGLQLPIGPLDVLAVPAVIILLVRWRSIRPTLPVLALGAYVLAQLVSLTSVADPHVRVQALLRVVRFAEMTLPFFLAATLSFDRRVSHRLMTLFAVGGGISVLLGIGMWLFSDVLQKNFGIVPYTAAVYQPDPQVEGEFVRIVHVRASGVLGDYMAYGHLIATWTVVSLGAVIPLARVRNVLWSLAIWGVGGSALLLSLTRGALLNLAAAVGSLFVLSWASRWRHVVKREVTIVLILTICAASLLLLWRPAELVSRVDAFGRRLMASAPVTTTPVDPGMASMGRVDLWTSYARLFWEHPVTGIGYKTLWLQRSIPPDNSYLGA
ncbi:MAG: O-antigen ligase family protein, partial [Candidatus Peregrinibacteria bacterium]